MTEIEFAELWFLLAQDMFNNYVLMSTAVFSYAVAVHFVGKELPRHIALGITLVLCIFVATTLLGFISKITHSAIVSAEYFEAYPEGFAVPRVPENIILFVGAVSAPLFILWIGAIYYFHGYVRKKDA